MLFLRKESNMPQYTSCKGTWHPAKEQIGLVNKSESEIEHNGKKIKPGEHFIYEGPDREAIKELFIAKQETFGSDFRRDTEFLQSVRNMGFEAGEKGVEAYLKFIGYDEEADDKKFKEEASVINRHTLPQRHKEILAMGGGNDTSGAKQDVIGGFGDERERKTVELKK